MPSIFNNPAGEDLRGSCWLAGKRRQRQDYAFVVAECSTVWISRPGSSSYNIGRVAFNYSNPAGVWPPAELDRDLNVEYARLSFCDLTRTPDFHSLL